MPSEIRSQTATETIPPTRRDGFGKLDRPVDYDKYLGQPVKFTFKEKPIYGILERVSTAGVYVFSRVPTLVPGEDGGIEPALVDEVLLSGREITSMTTASNREIELRLESLLPHFIHMGKPIRVKDGGENHFGVLKKFIEKGGVVLNPALIYVYPGDGAYLEYTEDLPLLVSSYVDIFPLKIVDQLYNIAKESRAEYEFERRKRRVELKKLEAEEREATADSKRRIEN